jgi:hypothetical protein
MKDDPISVCPECGAKVKRLLYPVGIVFKGTGWYINDSRAPEKGEKSESATAEKSESAQPAAISADTSTESKPATAPTETKAAPAATAAPSK